MLLQRVNWPGFRLPPIPPSPCCVTTTHPANKQRRLFSLRNTVHSSSSSVGPKARGTVRTAIIFSQEKRRSGLSWGKTRCGSHQIQVQETERKFKFAKTEERQEVTVVCLIDSVDKSPKFCCCVNCRTFFLGKFHTKGKRKGEGKKEIFN